LFKNDHFAAPYEVKHQWKAANPNIAASLTPFGGTRVGNHWFNQTLCLSPGSIAIGALGDNLNSQILCKPGIVGYNCIYADGGLILFNQIRYYLTYPLQHIVMS
jgi:hypothetical protein